MLLVCAGLLIRSLRDTEEAGPGFETSHVSLAAFDLRTSGYTAENASIYYGRLVEKIRTLPGVEAASLERFVPLWFTGRGYAMVEVEGCTPRRARTMYVDANVVGSDYLRTLRIPLISGRDFSEQDSADAPKVLIVNQTMANRFWPGRTRWGIACGHGASGARWSAWRAT